MASYELPIINGFTKPDNGGNTYFEPMSVGFATDALSDPMLVVFAGAASREGIAGMFTVPQNYTTAPSFKLKAATTATGNILVWDAEYKAVGATENFNTTALTTTPTVQMTLVGTVARDLLTASMSLTAGDFLAGDIVHYRLLRDGANTSDTYAGAAYLASLYFGYADS